MFPDTKRRLAAAHKELVDLVAGASVSCLNLLLDLPTAGIIIMPCQAGDESITSSEELVAAQQVLAEVTV